MRDRKYRLVIAGIVLLFLAIACSSNPPAPPAQPAKPAQPAQPAQPAAPATPSTAEPAGAPPAAQIFTQKCAVCHGADGKGGTKVAPKARDFTDAKFQAEKKDEDLVKSITNGIGTGKDAMPAWKDKLSEQEIKAMAAYVRTFAKK